jgi:hypothetical protein
MRQVFSLISNASRSANHVLNAGLAQPLASGLYPLADNERSPTWFNNMRRRKSFLDDLMTLPWWFNLALAAVVYFGLKY